MAGNACWGIEIGGGAIKALKLEMDGDDFKVVDFAVVNHPKVLSTPELDQDDAIRLALGTLASQHDLSGCPVAISFQGHQSFARFAKLPPVEPKKVPDIVKFEAVQQIPFPLEEVEWDYQTFVSPDSPDVEVGIFAVTKQRIAERLRILEDLGLTPDVATISPVAAYNALAVDLGFTESTPGTIIVDVGTMATDLVIAEAGRVWVRTFPIGGHQFTEAVASQFKLTYTKAEKLKREAEQTKHTRHVLQAMRPVFSDLAQEIQRSIGFYESVHSDADLKRLIGLGSTFKLPGLRKYLKQQLGLDVYRLEQFKKISVDGQRAGEFQAASLNLATAYGLALQGLEHAALKANLMPVEVLKTAMWKKKVPIFGAAAGLAACAAAAMFIRPVLDNAAFSNASSQPPPEIQRVVNDARRLKSEADAAQVTSGAADDLRASQIVSLLEDRQLYAMLMADAGAALAAAQAHADNSPNLDRTKIQPVFTVQYMDAVWQETLGDAGEDLTAADPGLGQDPYGLAGGGGRYDPRAQPGRYGPSDDPYATGFTDEQDDEESTERNDGLGGLVGTPHVRVRMLLQTQLEEREADLLIDNSIETWLEENAKRTGVPYELVFATGSEKSWQLTFGDQAGATPAIALQDDPYTDPAGGFGRYQQPGGVYPAGRPGAIDPRTGQPGAGPGQVQTRTYTAADLENLAPLVNPAADRPAPRGSVVVTFYAVPGGLASSEEEN
ncbi:MAG: type IV pilus assembly protein PilM [Phycisphaerales bacterium JB040]